jgi:hypothetical protein
MLLLHDQASHLFMRYKLAAFPDENLSSCNFRPRGALPNGRSRPGLTRSAWIAVIKTSIFIAKLVWIDVPIQPSG